MLGNGGGWGGGGVKYFSLASAATNISHSFQLPQIDVEKLVSSYHNKRQNYVLVIISGSGPDIGRGLPEQPSLTSADRDARPSLVPLLALQQYTVMPSSCTVCITKPYPFHAIGSPVVSAPDHASIPTAQPLLACVKALQIYKT